jgi:type II secretory pathway component PulF
MADFLIMDGEKKEVEKQKNSTDNIMDKPGKNFMDKINELLYSMQKIKIKEKVVIYRLLSTMINAGVSLVKSVSILEKQEKNPVLKKVL